MNVATESKVVSWLLDHPEFIPMCALCYLLWFLVARHIPLLLLREDKRSNDFAASIKELASAIQRLDRTMQAGLKEGPTRRRQSESGRLKMPPAIDKPPQSPSS